MPTLDNLEPSVDLKLWMWQSQCLQLDDMVSV